MRVYPRREWLLGGLLFAAIAAVALQAPIPQPLAYHDFADQRVLYGIPHFWNVVSNLPFTVIGVFGCWWVIRAGRTSSALEEPRERLAYALFFVGGILTGVGSAYYHADPTNRTLVWDRLPLSVMLTSMFAIVVGEFVDRRVGRLMLVPLLILGICSVVYWAHTESLGRGDLRPYLLVQFYPMLAMFVILLLFPSRYTGGTAFWLLLALYAVAKIAETYDRAILEASGFWSGHTIKHSVAAVASYVPLYWLQHRTALRSTRTRIPSGFAEIPLLTCELGSGGAEATVSNDTLNEPRCSFCQKSEDQVRKLIQASSSVLICDECVEVCNDILADTFDRPSAPDEREANDEPGLFSFKCPACGHQGTMRSRA